MEKTVLENRSSVKTTLKLPGKKDFFTQEAFKTLRTNLQFCGQDICTVVITSCNENEGKTTITLQLAKSLAELNKRVLVIDADMRKSVMAGRNTTAENPAGLSEVLTGLTSVKDCLYQTQYENLSIMFAGKYPPNPVELLSGQYFEELLNAAKESYDYVLIDVPPLGSVIDAAVVAAKCDGTILVISDNQVRYRQALEVIEQLKKVEAKFSEWSATTSRKRTADIIRSITRIAINKSQKNIEFEQFLLEKFLTKVVEAYEKEKNRSIGKCSSSSAFGRFGFWVCPIKAG